MKTLRIDRRHTNKTAIAMALSILNDGGVVVFPTETAYGLAADPRNPRAVKKIFCIKGREESKKLPLVATSMRQVELFFLLGKDIKRLVKRYWPGPLTVVLRKNELVADRTEKAKTQDVTPTTMEAVRIPGAVWARALPAALGYPVTATSANRSGEPACYTATAVRRAFCGRRHQPDLFLDAGRLPRRPPSTIIKLERGSIRVLRQGAIKVK